MSEIQRAQITLMVKALLDRGGLITLPSVSALLPGCSSEITIGSDLKDNIVIKVAGKKLASIPIADPNYDKKLDNVISKLHLVSLSPAGAYWLIKKLGATEEYEAIVAGDAKYAYQYASKILKGPYPAGEAAIAQSAEYAYWYASKILKGPFPAGEAAIATNGVYAYNYAREVLKGPFPAGEAAIATNPPAWGYPWLNARYVFEYAAWMLKGPFPAGEATIAKDAEHAYYYALNVLKGPFPAGEAAIAEYDAYAYLYALNVLKLPEAEARNWSKNYLAQKGIKV